MHASSSIFVYTKMHKWTTHCHKQFIWIYLYKRLVAKMTKRLFQWWLIFKWAKAKKLEEPYKHSCCLKSNFRGLYRAEQKRHCCVISQYSLLGIRQFPLYKWYNSKNDQLFITLPGFDLDAWKSPSGDCTDMWQIQSISYYEWLNHCPNHYNRSKKESSTGGLFALIFA